MKNGFSRKLIALLIAALLLCPAALADNVTVEVDGTVVNTAATPVTASYTGTVAELTVREGSYVKQGDTIAVLSTTKVYATASGTVRLFGTPGDSTTMVTDHYGAVAYIEPDVQFTISSSTRNAYDAEENRTIHPGETVYLRGNSNLTHVGTGVVTTVSGSDYSVDVIEGNFVSSESVNIYRDAAYSTTARIGRGNTSRSSYSTYEGSGIIVSYCVADGSHVNVGDVLFETIEGDFAGYGTDLTVIKAPVSGVISSLSISLGTSVTAGDTVCVLYPDEALRVEASVNEEYLSLLKAGTTVQVHFTYVNDGEYTVSGTVEQVSACGTDSDSDDSDEAFFNAIIRLDDITDVSYGMTVTVLK